MSYEPMTSEQQRLLLDEIASAALNSQMRKIAELSHAFAEQHFEIPLRDDTRYKIRIRHADGRLVVFYDLLHAGKKVKGLDQDDFDTPTFDSVRRLLEELVTHFDELIEMNRLAR